MAEKIKFLASVLAVVALSFIAAVAQSGSTAAQKAEANAVPVIDGGIGSCTADFTITDNTGAPVYDATIKVHISYGVFHKLDLQVGTNSNGKARFTGLPEKTKQGLFFQASKADRTGSAFDDTAKTCNGQFTVALEKNSQ
ncbi:MAG: hypothetical protein WA252_11970 [Candidatus Sulfotelmatobacter sp.]|jgi:hypothetical protein